MEYLEAIWWEQFCLQADALTTAALCGREEEFSRQYAGESKKSLLAYLRKCAEELGYTPQPTEIIGSDTIINRFSGWDAAVAEAGLPPVLSGLEAPPLQHTALYRAELYRQWLRFKETSAEQWRRQKVARSKAKSKAKSANNKLQKELSTNSRQKKEREFAQAHAACTEQELYELLKDEKRRRGKSMSPINTVGFLYYIQRLGPWRVVIGKINAELREERRCQAELDPKEAPPVQIAADSANSGKGTVEDENK